MMYPTHGRLVSFEGISGCGKTYLTRALQSKVNPHTSRFVTEVVDREGSTCDRDIITILASCGDRFFRSGKPLTETFLLLALKMCDYESVIAPSLAQGQLVIEDRSIDTIAIYQSLLLHPRASIEQQLAIAHDLYALAERWRQAPDLTFFIEDHFEVALARVEQRERQVLTADERAILFRAQELYRRYIPAYASRIVPLDRRTCSSEELLQTICASLEPCTLPEA